MQIDKLSSSTKGLNQEVLVFPLSATKYNSLGAAVFNPPQAFDLAVPFVWKVHFLRPPNEFLPVTQVSVQSSSLQRPSLLPYLF